MRKIIVHEFITLDGVIQAPGGADEDTDGGFTHGGWTWPYWHDEIGALIGVAMQQSDAFLLGRRTWQGHGAAFDPMPEGDPFGDAMKAIQKYVVSTTLTNTDLWRNSTLIRGNVVDLAVAVVIIGSLLPSTSAPMQVLSGVSDKALHFLGYLVLALLPAVHERRKVLIALICVAIVIGIALEFAQTYSVGRFYERADIAADIAGIAVGLLLGLRVR